MCYLVARDVQTGVFAAVAAVGKWKEAWKIATFPTDEKSNTGAGSELDDNTAVEYEVSRLSDESSIVELEGQAHNCQI